MRRAHLATAKARIAYADWKLNKTAPKNQCEGCIRKLNLEPKLNMHYDSVGVLVMVCTAVLYEELL